MPIYEFVCHDCGTNFEKRVSFTQTTTPPCDTCESSNVQRQMSAPAIHFKGSGWYITDSKKSNSANGSSKAESKTESSKAPASTPEPVAA
ncbi:MAG: zinc ribbon domain-containing protein [Caldilineaceae bacterium]